MWDDGNKYSEPCLDRFELVSKVRRARRWKVMGIARGPARLRAATRIVAPLSARRAVRALPTARRSIGQTGRRAGDAPDGARRGLWVLLCADAVRPANLARTLSGSRRACSSRALARSLEHGVIGGLTAALPRSCARMHTRRVQAPKDFPEEAINKSTGGYFDANEKLYGK